MPITSNDIKLMASARMVDAADGGGRMAGSGLQDGLNNNVFPGISSPDRVTGAVQFRKVYPAVLNAGNDALRDANVLLEDLPDDPSVAGILLSAASSLQTVSDITAALNAAGESYGFFGASPVEGTVASGSTAIPVLSLRAPLIPKAVLTTAESGGLEETGAQPTTTGWEPTGQTVPLTVSGSSLVADGFFGRVRPGSVTGTFTAPGGAGTVTSNADGVVTMTAPGFSATLHWSDSYPILNFVGTVSLSGLTDVSITAEALLRTVLPRSEIVVPAVDGQVVYEISLPPGTSIASEVLRVSYRMGAIVLGGPIVKISSVYSLGSGRETFPVHPADELIGSAFLSRATGLLTVVLKAPLPSDGDILVGYAEGGNTSPLLPAALVSSGLFSGNTASVTPSVDTEAVSATFSIAGGEAGLVALGGVIRNSTNVVRGALSTSGAITVPSNDGRTITGWHGVQRSTNYAVSSVTATLPTDIQPDTLTITGLTGAGASFTATASAAGVFATAHVAGTYNSVTGALLLNFAAGTKLRSLEYAGTRNLPQTSFATLYGLNPAVFASDGTVPVLAAGRIVALRHSATVAAATYANGNTINCGRTDLADVRVVGSDGIGISTGWSVNLETGIVTVNDISGWEQPVTVRHSIEHLALALSTPNAGTVTLSRATTREFPPGSILASALMLGDFQARAGATFAQESWTSVWQDTRIGSSIAPQYQDTANPILTTNRGAINERWAIIFLTSTTFRVVGETTGQIAVGDINTTLAPVNSTAGVPYFTLAAPGWGSGWSAGNVLRFNTYGANAPVWAVRSVIPSAPSSDPDSILIAIRGDIDA